MNIDSLRKHFEVWKYLLFIDIGASAILFLQAVLFYIESKNQMFPISWFGAWFVAMLASFLPGFVLLWGKHWMQFPLHERLNVIFGYFAVTWFTLLPAGIRIVGYESKAFNFILLGVATAIVVGYAWLRRKSREIFP
jgi:hypothetical protein